MSNKGPPESEGGGVIFILLSACLIFCKMFSFFRDIRKSDYSKILLTFFLVILNIFRNSEFQENYIKFGAKIVEFRLEIAKFTIISLKITKTLNQVLLNCVESSGAKDSQSWRSRKTLQKAYLIANIGFDTAENEASKV